MGRKIDVKVAIQKPKEDKPKEEPYHAPPPQQQQQPPQQQQYNDNANYHNDNSYRGGGGNRGGQMAGEHFSFSLDRNHLTANRAKETKNI
jgi:hypothetical protein